MIRSASFLAAGLFAGTAFAADVTVDVFGLVSADGSVRAVLYDSADAYAATQPTYRADAPARLGETTVVFRDVPPGRYGLAAFHDANDDRTLNRGFLGRPVEGMGFGNDARMERGRPTFDAIVIDIHDGMERVGLSVRY